MHGSNLACSIIQSRWRLLFFQKRFMWYRVRHGKLFFFNWLWQVELCKLVFLKVVLKSWDFRNFVSATSFYNMHTVHHLRSYLQTCQLFFGKKILNATTVKKFPKNKIQCFWRGFDAFLFPPLIQGKSLSIWWFVWKWPLKLAIIQNLLIYY